MRPVLYCAVLAAAVVGGFFYAAVRTLTDQEWPEW